MAGGPVGPVGIEGGLFGMLSSVLSPAVNVEFGELLSAVMAVSVRDANDDPL